MKKVLSFILVLSMVLGSFGMTFAAPAVTGNPAVDAMVELGFVTGDEGGLRLNDTIKRSEVAAIAARVLGLEEAAQASNWQGQFADVTPAHWANGYVNIAAGKGLVNGYPDGTFGPENNITNAEVVTMMVRMLLDAKELEAVNNAGPWPGNYVAKAIELGLLDGVSVANYDAAAVRELVFTVGYNAYAALEDEALTGYKALVVENYRTEALDKDEIVIEIIKDVQDAELAEIGDEYSVTVTGDAEELLGKVLDVKFDEKGNVVGFTVDNDYKYVTGAVTLRDNSLTVGTTRYTVDKQERRTSNDERFFQAYLNNEALTYDNLLAETTSLEYARVTVKNGKVLFVDGFNFDDVAPVQEVKKDGEEVYVYNDARNGGVKKIDVTKSANVIFVEDGVFSQGTRADIDALDVVHTFQNGNYTTTRVDVLVRKDSSVAGEYTKTTLNSAGTRYVHIDEDSYVVSFDSNKKAVYAYDSKEFFTLESAGIESTLRPLKDKEVQVLLDVRNRVQYIGAAIETPEFIGLLDNIVSKDVRVVKPGNTKEVYSTNFDSTLRLGGNTTQRSLSAFNKADLVYLETNEDSNVVEMTQLFAFDNSGSELANKLVGTTWKQRISKDAIEFRNGDLFRILDRTDVFVRTQNTAGVWTLKAVTMDEILDNYVVTGQNTIVEAKVITDNEFVSLLPAAKRDNRPNSTQTARAIVFTQIELEKEALDYSIVKVTGKDAAGAIREIRVEDNYGNAATHEFATSFRGLYNNVVIGDIIEIGLNDNEMIEKVTVLIPNNAATAGTYRVVSVTGHTDYKQVRLVDAAGAQRTKWVPSTAKVFGNIEENARISFSEHEAFAADEMTVVRVRPANTALTYWTAQTPNTQGALSLRFVAGTSADNLVIEVTDANGNFKTYKRADGEISHDVANFLHDYKVALDDTNITFGFNTDGNINAIKVVNLGANHGTIMTIPNVSAFNGLVINGFVNATTTRSVGNLTVEADNVVVQNLQATGTVIVGTDVLNFTAENTNFNNLTINGGGSNSIHLNAAKVTGTMTVNKIGVRVEMVGADVAAIVVAAKDAKLEVKGSTKVTKLTVNATGVNLTQTTTATITEVDGTEELENAEYTPAVNAAHSSVTGVVYEEGTFTVTFVVKDQVGKTINNIKRPEVEVKVDGVLATLDTIATKTEAETLKYVVTFAAKAGMEREVNADFAVKVKDVGFDSYTERQ